MIHTPRNCSVVSYRNSTSNHNLMRRQSVPPWLYLIEILHQTTTGRDAASAAPQLYLIEILHQTTTRACVLARKQPLYLIEILHQTTTLGAAGNGYPVLYLIEILHQTTTRSQFLRLFAGCILSKFYIKPQHRGEKPHRPGVVSYRNSTSNHNYGAARRATRSLYLIEILHQTTTPRLNKSTAEKLYLIEILHQTTTSKRDKQCRI